MYGNGFVTGLFSGGCKFWILGGIVDFVCGHNMSGFVCGLY